MKLSLGIKHMLIDAIVRHRKAHHGALPRRIELHPATYAELLASLDAREFPMPREDGRLDVLPLRGVDVYRDSNVMLAKLITVDNIVEYL